MSNASTTHLAALLPSKDSHHHTLQSVPTPVPGPRELLISVHAVALNPVDTYMRDMGIFLSTYPATIGSDVAGTIEAVGSDIPSSSGFTRGVRVLAFAPAFQRGGAVPYGAFQEKVAVPFEAVCPIPLSLSFTDAATMPMGVLTAWSGFTSLGLPRSLAPIYTATDNQALLVWGASSSMGMSTIQVAKSLGYTQIYATSSPKHHGVLQSLGATHTFDYRSPTVTIDIIATAQNDGAVLKTCYRATGAIQPCLDILSSLSSEGKLASAVNLDATTPSHPVVQSVFVSGPQDPAEAAKHMQFVFQEWLAPRLAQGKHVPGSKVRVVGGLQDVDSGLDVLKKGVSGEKLVLEVQVE